MRMRLEAIMPSGTSNWIQHLSSWEQFILFAIYATWEQEKDKNTHT